MTKNVFRKVLVIGIIVLFVGTATITGINNNIFETNVVNDDSRNQSISSVINESLLDLQFIYNITENLSNIIFTEYNESTELARGRAFGSKGEHKAAEILYENMSKLGLYTEMEQIHNISGTGNKDLETLTHRSELIDYGLIIKKNNSNINESVDCYINPLKVDPKKYPNEYEYNFSGKVKRKPKILSPWHHEENEEYVFIEESTDRNPNASLTLLQKIMRFFFYPIRTIVILVGRKRNEIERKILNMSYPQCKGIIIYDWTNDTHIVGYGGGNGSILPTIRVNGTIGTKIYNDPDNYTVDFYVKQRYNDSVVSYNVIGQRNGTGPNSCKTVIVCSLYDSVMCQGTGDSAIGMAIVLGIAKYFFDHNITPNYNLKFIGFGGEEAGARGAIYYEANQTNENISYVIDINQVGFTQEDPQLTLNLFVNKLGFMNEICEIVRRTDYVKRTGNTIAMRWWPEGAPSNDQIFAINRPFCCKTICFLKDYPWIWHHRDGLNHKAGDVMDYFNWDDVSATGEIVLNVTKYLVKPSVITNDFNKKVNPKIIQRKAIHKKLESTLRYDHISDEMVRKHFETQKPIIDNLDNKGKAQLLFNRFLSGEVDIGTLKQGLELLSIEKERKNYEDIGYV